MRFRIAIDDAAAVKALRELVKRGEDMRPLMRSVGELLLNSTRARFDSSTM